MAWVPADRLPGFRAWLEDLVGTLALFEVVEHPEPPPSPSAPRPEPPRAPPPAEPEEPPNWEPGEADLADRPLHAEGWWPCPLESVPPTQWGHEGVTEVMDLRRNEEGEPVALADRPQGAGCVRVLRIMEDAEPVPETMTAAEWDALPPWAGLGEEEADAREHSTTMIHNDTVSPQ